MAIFPLLTQLVNETTSTLSFNVDHRGRRLLPKLLSPGRTRCARVYRVLDRIQKLRNEQGWKIRVLRDGQPTGVELDPQDILDYVRITFRDEVGQLCLYGVKEIKERDLIYRHRYIGYKRDSDWNNRTYVRIVHTSGTRNNVEGHRLPELLFGRITTERIFELLSEFRAGSKSP